MNNFFLYIRFGTYMIKTAFKKKQVEKIRKTKGNDEAEKFINNYVLNWSDYILKNVKIDLEVQGLENLPKENCLYVANHQSLFDIPVLLAGIRRPMGFIAKKEIKKIKIISDWMEMINCVFIDRENIRESVKAINKGIDNLKKGHSMVIFPEGTRNKQGEIGEFKQGSMKLALKSGVPVVPVAIDGTYKLREGNKNKKIRPGKVRLIIKEPIYLDKLDKEYKNKLANNIREIIKNELS
ncbi:lysophospholipid acyltransferase family protein [Clostridium cochlearium]|uniref:1-acyl-sn-glycerol-3-phosphate acyltransferase n=1 Tax=Clostridium cochlearium TaxID=1494 RepID=A0ABY0QKT3_CLOCO|nr:lysophospholipid acyltransferase family protein [Clostridium cochlearium]MBV1820562.1 1-acyl-sn-glycerol-3-phosphate acyltransferase [Bacteroidales bacterium MSK.15.36]NSJ92408.1 1-acyl-sn-glycerol-3-phosphate acyltransferase [Coprococcus sp. MSK.21.13]MBE6065868.1 1-acyl-sn-glycerol-3-phosphate acyltransferase [Clostridium cochlearium]MCG4572175.1 1-acyl-sn-glycerol-3-phosphate acyltransferase [Clostridium cochlearium]MCG4579703.1 1-acyl-sn-glycerol-3-phosphate acyltransferase [Clostridium